MKFEKYSVVFFKAFSKKKVFGGPLITTATSTSTSTTTNSH